MRPASWAKIAPDRQPRLHDPGVGGRDINGQEDLQTVALAGVYEFPDELHLGLGYSFTTG